MRKNKILLSVIFGVALALMSVNLVSGAYNWSLSSLNITIADVPGVDVKQTVVGSNATGTTILLNVTANKTLYDNGGAGLNCSFYATSASTANSTEQTGVLNISIPAGDFKSPFAVGNHTNSSANSTYGYINITNQILQDANNYVFTARCVNLSGTSREISVTGITVDNSVPQTPTGLTPDRNNSIIKNTTDLYFQSTVNGWNTTSCTINFAQTNPGSASYTGTHSGNTCVHTLTTGASAGSYPYYITASDGTNTTVSSTITFEVNPGSTSSVGQAIATGQLDLNQQDEKGFFSVAKDSAVGLIGKTLFGIPIFVLVIIGIAIIVLTKK